MNQFPDLKKKIEKRGRKLVDYDSAKNSFNSVKASSKKDNDPKLAKATMELQAAEQMYTEMNNELLEILPAVFDSRITFFVDTLQTLFNANSVYQTDASKFHKQIVMQLDKLGESMDYLRVARPEARALTPIDTTSLASSDAPATPDQNKSDNSSLRQTPSPSVLPSPVPAPMAKPRESVVSMANSTNPFDDDDAEHDKEATPTDVEEKFEAKVYPKLNAQQTAAAEQAIAAAKREKKEASNPFDDEDDESTEVEEAPKKKDPEPTPKPLDGITNEKRKTLYFVTSTHNYKAVDTDELSFEQGVQIKVIEANEDDQLDDGWRLGELEDGKRGVFPENFTKKV